MRRLARPLLRTVGIIIVVIAVLAGVDVVYVFAGMRAEDLLTRTLNVSGLTAPVTIARDARYIPHIRAQNEHDMFFAQGYAEGTDRLFQIDLYRRFVYGQLSEVLGALAVQADMQGRVIDIHTMVEYAYAHSSDRDKVALTAFADGVNAAMAREPLPPEFRLLAYHPTPWKPQDSIAVGFATVLDLADKWDDVALRADIVKGAGADVLAAMFPLTDPKYEAPTTAAKAAPLEDLPPLNGAFHELPAVSMGEETPRSLGSNEFAAGAARTTTGRALLANDPHLRLGIPGVWYVLDLQAPGFHAAGASLVGIPGVILGHNDHVAWGATNGTVAGVTLYREHFRSADSDEYNVGGEWVKADHRVEHFNVRLGFAKARTYLRTRHGFVIDGSGVDRYAAEWVMEKNPINTLSTFLNLDRAASIYEARATLSQYPGPTQNFVLADTFGNAAYTLAGMIPIDSFWGRDAYDGAVVVEGTKGFVPFEQLPSVYPGRGVVAFTANNRMYGENYRYALSPGFAPPYRAFRINEMLRAKQKIAPADFSAIQADVTSVAERELAHEVSAALLRMKSDAECQCAALLGTFDGKFDQRSEGATLITGIRRAAVARFAYLHLPPDLAKRYLANASNEGFVAVMRMLRERPKGYVPKDDYDRFLVDATADAVKRATNVMRSKMRWGLAWQVTPRHPLANLGVSQWNGTPFPGYGGPFTPHVQNTSFSQSFRAVWDIGNWDEGGIVIPQGESGRPGSPHFRDLATTWIDNKLVALPYSDAAVKVATRNTLTLQP